MIPKDEAEDLANRADELKGGFFKENAECPTKVLKMFEDAAHSGNLFAMLRAGEMCLNGAVSINAGGNPVTLSSAKAGKYLLALLKHPDIKDVSDSEDLNFEIKVQALVHYGDVLFFKSGKKCEDNALKKYREAADMGDGHGQYKIGWFYLQKSLTAKSKTKDLLVQSLKCMREAVEMNSGDAAATMRTLYENPNNEAVYPEGIAEFEGRELSKQESISRAEYLYRKSAELECATGCNDLGG